MKDKMIWHQEHCDKCIWILEGLENGFISEDDAQKMLDACFADALASETDLIVDMAKEACLPKLEFVYRAQKYYKHPERRKL